MKGGGVTQGPQRTAGAGAGVLFGDPDEGRELGVGALLQHAQPHDLLLSVGELPQRGGHLLLDVAQIDERLDAIVLVLVEGPALHAQPRHGGALHMPPPVEVGELVARDRVEPGDGLLV